LKIAICGKGGSGKSTITALLARAFNSIDYQVLIVDSDESNSGLFRKLGMKSPPIPIMDMIGGRQGFKNKKSAKLVIGDSAKNQDLLDDKSFAISDIPAKNITSNNGISLIIVGKIEQAMEGCACPMGVVNREFLHKLHLTNHQIAIVDTEAGLEHFGRGLETTLDGTVIVVDPSYESIDYAEKALKLTRASGIGNTWVIINKVNSENVKQRLKELLDKRGIPLTATIDYNDKIFETELAGRSLVDSTTNVDLQKIIKLIIETE
jgi:CO dehydrogenase maturation factor